MTVEEEEEEDDALGDSDPHAWTDASRTSCAGQPSSSPLLAGTKFVVRPPRPPGFLATDAVLSEEEAELEGGGGGDGQETARGGAGRAASAPAPALEGGDVPPTANSESCVWWAVGRDLPSASLISARPLPCRPPAPCAGSSVAAASVRPSVRGGARDAARSSRGERRARASIDRSRQRILDLEAFISELLRRPEAFPRRSEGVKRARGRREASPTPVCGPAAATAGEGGGFPAFALAKDYHCVTVGLTEAGHRVRAAHPQTSVDYPRSRREITTNREGYPSVAGYVCDFLEAFLQRGLVFARGNCLGCGGSAGAGAGRDDSPRRVAAVGGRRDEQRRRCLSRWLRFDCPLRWCPPIGRDGLAWMEFRGCLGRAKSAPRTGQ